LPGEGDAIRPDAARALLPGIVGPDRIGWTLRPPMEDRMAPVVFTLRDRLRVAHAALKAFCRISTGEIEDDLERIESLDQALEGLYLVAYWEKLIDNLFQMEDWEKTADEDGRLKLILERFGDALGEPSARMKLDIARRLDWTKRRIAKDFERDFRYSIDVHRITSPIEQIFLMEWKYSRAEERLGVVLQPQRALPTSRGDFTVDFCVAEHESRKPIVLIEIDGHEFHEKTREQVRSDKKRERAIVQAGATVLRFSGSEIFKEPRSCVREVIEFIEAQIPS
jgi:very-short-patch-repair endonuclease